MSIVIPDGFAQVTVKCTMPGSLGGFDNVWGLTVVSQPTQDDINAASTLLLGPWISWLNDHATANGIHVVLNLGGLNQTWDSSTGADPGTADVDTFCPPQVQGLVRKFTATPGRPGVGHFFAPMLVEAEVDDSGNLSEVEFDRLGVLAANFVDAFNELDDTVWGPPVLLHSNVAIAPSPITALSAEKRVATLRGRYRRK